MRLFVTGLLVGLSVALLTGQKITGDTTLCVGDRLELKVEGLNPSPERAYKFSWTFGKRWTGEVKSTYGRDALTITDSGKFECLVTTIDPRKDVDEAGHFISETKLGVTVRVNEAPAKLPLPSYTISGNDANLHVARNERNLTFNWVGPEQKKYNGAVVNIEKVNFGQLGLYQLTITDTVTGCLTSLELDLGARNENAKPSNIFGTIDDDTGQLTGVIRMTDRDFPVYPTDIFGRKVSDSYEIAEIYSLWQIIAELDNHYVIKYLPDNKDRADVVEFYQSYGNLVARVDSLYEELEAGEGDPETNFAPKERGNEYYRNVANIHEEISLAVDAMMLLFEDARGKRAFRYDQGLPVEDFLRDYGIPEETFGMHSLWEASAKYFEEFADRMNSSRLHNKYFIVDRSDFEVRARVYKYRSSLKRPGFTAGTVLIPVKLRFDEFQFSKDITLGPYFGMKWLMSNYRPNYFSLGVTTGITSVTLSQRNTNSSFVAETQDVAAFTLAIGGILEFNKVQLGLFGGWDWINGNIGSENGINWAYQGEPWLSIGLGYSIISRPSPGKAKNRQ